MCLTTIPVRGCRSGLARAWAAKVDQLRSIRRKACENVPRNIPLMISDKTTVARLSSDPTKRVNPSHKFFIRSTPGDSIIT